MRLAMQLLLVLVAGLALVRGGPAPGPTPVPEPKPHSLADEQRSEYWNELGQASIRRAHDRVNFDLKAKNTILFLGDGMGVSTLTAARILKGQLQGKSGEEDALQFERFPNAALIKTYNVDRQVPDSAGTATAYLTGVKANMGVLGVGPDVNVTDTDCAKIKRAELESIMEMARKAGKAIGVVTNTRITHATPAASYAHVAHRDWEYDGAVPTVTRDAGCKDIAHQLIHAQPGQSFNVIFGGGRRNFLPAKPGDGSRLAMRTDGLNLIDQWKEQRRASGLKEDQFAYVETKQQLAALDPKRTKHVLGLFAVDHLEYESVASLQATRDEPSLTEMTEAAVRILSQQPNGFVLLVEGGRIDHAHHGNQAKRALHETVEFDRAVTWADRNLDPSEALLVVTADHSHTLTLSGYPKRGNNIFETTGEMEAETGLPLTTLMYATGPGHRQPRWTQQDDLNSLDYRQYSAVKTKDANHGGEDVALYSRGPMAHLFHGLQEQSYITHVMAYATCIGRYTQEAHCAGSISAKASNLWLYIVIAVLIVGGVGFYFYRRNRQS